MNSINNCDHRQCYHDTTKMYSREFHSDHCLHYNLEWFTLILDSIRPSTCVHLKKKIQRKLRTDSFANSYWDRPIFCKFCTVTDVPNDRKVSVTFPHLVCMYMYSKKWRNVYICLTYDLRLKNMNVHFFVSIFFGSFIILWLQKCVIASKITFLLQRSGAFEF